MRTYETIWYRLKTMPHSEASSSGISITTPRHFHKRIIKAVIKEKWLDVGYKITLYETMQGKRAIIEISRSNSILKFTLKFSLTAADL